MAYRLPAERVRLDLDGPSVEVEPALAFAPRWQIARLVQAFYDAEPGDPEVVALVELYRAVLPEMQPVWDIVDHRGPVPPTADGFLRLPVALALSIIGGWLETGVEKTTAVDEVIPPGPARDELNRRLRSARRRKAA